MDVFWGDRLSSETKGLDVMGIRTLDQNIEASLTNGITTISSRARYISILAWAIGQYFSEEAGDGRGIRDDEARARYLNRVRFMVLAATVADDGASRSGVLGYIKFRDQVAELAAGGTVQMPTEPNAAILGTYFGPTSALGLVESKPASSGLPYGLTSRGTVMFEERQLLLENTGLLGLLRDGGDLDYETAKRAIPAFSLARTGEFGREAELLREAFTEAWEPTNMLAAKRVAESYQRMADTRAWIDRERAVDANSSANDLIARNYDKAVANGATAIELEWASFEWHRRVHFALELLLSAVIETLLQAGSLSLPQVVSIWAAVPGAGAAAHWHDLVQTAAAAVTPGQLTGSLLRPANFMGAPATKAIRAFELLVTQARDADAIGIRHDTTKTRAPSVRATELVLGSSGTLAEAMAIICDECVAQRHISNTMRKMGNNQDCSLRFYPEGPLLVATEIDFSPGYSGSRLQNAMQILSDLNMLAIGPDDDAMKEELAR